MASSPPDGAPYEVVADSIGDEVTDVCSILTTPGLHLYCGGPERQKSQILADGIARSAIAHREFLSDLRHGVVPPIGKWLKLPPPAVHARLLSIRNVLGVRGTLLGALDEAHGELLHALLDSTSRRCVTCSERIPLFKSITSVESNIAQAFDGTRVRLELRGDENTIRNLGETQGFSIVPTEQGSASLLLDEVNVTSSTLDRIRSTIIPVWNSSNSWVFVTNGTVTRGYAPGGACLRCESVAPRLRPDSLARTLKSTTINSPPPNADVLIELNGVPLWQLLHQPVDSLRNMVCTLPNLTQSLVDLERLGLGSVSAGVQLDELGLITRGLVGVVSMLGSIPSTAPLLVDFPPFSSDELDLSAVREFLIEKAQTRPIILALARDVAPDHQHASPSTRPSSGTAGIEVLTHEGEVFAISHPSDADLYDRVAPLLTHLKERLSIDDASLVHLSPATTFFRGRSMFIEELDLYERVSRMFAASTDARMAGVGATAFKRGGQRSSAGICPSCRSLGYLLHESAVGDRPNSEVCSTCSGKRFGDPLAGIRFRETSMSTLLDTTLKDANSVLRTLPKAKEVLDLASALHLDSIALGHPAALLSFSESRVLRFIQTFLMTRNKRSLVVIEAPLAGLSEKQVTAFVEALARMKSLSRSTYLLLGDCHRFAGVATQIAL